MYWLIRQAVLINSKENTRKSKYNRIVLKNPDSICLSGFIFVVSLSLNKRVTTKKPVEILNRLLSIKLTDYFLSVSTVTVVVVSVTTLVVSGAVGVTTVVVSVVVVSVLFSALLQAAKDAAIKAIAKNFFMIVFLKF